MDQTPGPGAGPGAEPVVAEAGPVDWVEITADPISQLRVTQFVTESAAGAISVFLGEGGRGGQWYLGGGPSWGWEG